MDFIMVWTYAAYLVLSLGLTIFVARTLHKNGRIFLVDSFQGNESIADSNAELAVDLRQLNLQSLAQLEVECAERLVQ